MNNIFLGQPPSNIKTWIIEKYCTPLCFEAVDAGATIALKCNGSNLASATFQTSTDNENWTDYTYATNITLANVGDKVYFKADVDNTSIVRNLNNYLQFTTTQNSKKVNISGNIMSLLAPEFGQMREITQRSCFYALFENCKNVYDCNNLNLPATTLAGLCYNYMFSGCSTMVYAPALPAIILADGCYFSMFNNCSSLVQAPSLPATTLTERCYNAMFSGCSTMVYAPALPAIILANRCYSSMFSGCSSLTQASALPATTLTEECYRNMFNNCSSLAQAPALPATQLADLCYNNMFSGCSSLTQAPRIQAFDSDLEDIVANMLYCKDQKTQSWGQLTTCNWPDLTVTEVESMILTDLVFGADDAGSGVNISITCKNGSGTAYFDDDSYSWVFVY